MQHRPITGSISNVLDNVPVLFLIVFMQPAFHFAQTADLRSIQDRLTAQFGRIRVEERFDPVTQFVGSFLGSRTYDQVSRNALAKLMRRYPVWDALADAPEADIEAVITGVKYPEKKAPNLKRALRKIRALMGAIDLDFLADWPVEEGLSWLEQNHGVGRKIAAATLNFSSLRRPAFVVDTHVLRVLQRFGFVGANAVAENAYDAVMAAADGFDADDLFELHWHLKGLGQEACPQERPRCVSCPLSDICLQRVEEGAPMVMRVSGCVA